MKIAAALLLAAAAFGVLTMVCMAGWMVGMRRSYTLKLHSLGINRNTVGLYHDATRLLYRLDGTADLSGLTAGDVLSPETREQVTAWVTKHRKEINA